MTPFCCLCLPSLMRKLTVQERGFQQRLGVSSIKLVPFLNDDTKYDVDLCTWVYQIVYTRSFESGDGDLRIVPLADVSNNWIFFSDFQSLRWNNTQISLSLFFKVLTKRVLADDIQTWFSSTYVRSSLYSLSFFRWNDVWFNVSCLCKKNSTTIRRTKEKTVEKDEKRPNGTVS